MELRNQKIIDAIIEKAGRDCPGALAMIGVYGSFLTGDIHEKSDLDLLILINDDRGYALSKTFIQEDIGVGHDLYCTTWDMLEKDAKFTHPHISKLMDSRIVYCADNAYLAQLESFRKQALAADTRESAENTLAEAEHSFAKAILAKDLADIRRHAGDTIHKILDAVALLNGRYFRLSTRRIFQEIDAMERKPENLPALVDSVISAESEETVKSALHILMDAAEQLFCSPLPASEAIPGTYEEMFSNWRNKMHLAAENQNRYLAFDSMHGLDSMLKALGFSYDVLVKFIPQDLTASAVRYDEIMETYRKEYDKAGLPVQLYSSVDAFIEDYLKKETAL